MTTLSAADQTKQMQLVDLALQRIIGVTPGYFRPPYGEYDEVTQQVAFQQNKKIVSIVLIIPSN